MRRSRELAELLLQKAQQGEFALDKLMPDLDSPDEIIGFHAQQAIEKMLKAVPALAAAVGYFENPWARTWSTLGETRFTHFLPYPRDLADHQKSIAVFQGGRGENPIILRP